MDKILLVYNTNQRLEPYIPTLEGITQTYGKKNKNYYIIPPLQFETGNVLIDSFFNLLAQKCLFENYVNIMFVID